MRFQLKEERWRRNSKALLTSLRAFVEKSGFDGDWSDGPGKYVFRSRNGAILNWWGAHGTVQFQGEPTDRSRLEAIFGDGASLSERVNSVPAQAQEKHQIFIVHGHDTDARDQLELALRRLGLEPFILMNTSGGCQTIIEALEGQIGRDFRSDFGIVLMTPDDRGYLQADGPERAEPRPRQNVVLETGMLLASLTRSRMAILVKGYIEIPSDLRVLFASVITIMSKRSCLNYASASKNRVLSWTRNRSRLRLNRH